MTAVLTPQVQATMFTDELAQRIISEQHVVTDDVFSTFPLPMPPQGNTHSFFVVQPTHQLRVAVVAYVEQLSKEDFSKLIDHDDYDLRVYNIVLTAIENPKPLDPDKDHAVAVLLCSIVAQTPVPYVYKD